jgi:hypothetical protein
MGRDSISQNPRYTVKKDLTKLSLDRNNLIIPGHRECLVMASDIPAEDGKIIDIFLQCRLLESLSTPLDKNKIFQPDLTCLQK